MAVGLPLKTTYANGDVYSASDVNDTNGTINITAAPYAAGKNKIINGALNVWQRGTSFSTTGVVYCADRFLTNTGSVSSFSAVQTAFSPGSAPGGGYESQFFLDIAGTLSNASTGYLQIEQRIEDVRTFAAATVTLSFWAKGTSSGTVNTLLGQNFGSGGSAEVLTATSSQSITTSWQRFTQTVTLASISGKTLGTGNMLKVYFVKNMGSSYPSYGSSNYTGTLSIWGVQLEQGSTATAFQTATGTIQGELAACQRYYFRVNGNGNFNPLGTGYAKNTTAADGFIPLPTMRTAPTSVDFTNLQIVDGTTVFSSTSLTLGGSATNMARVDMTGFSGLTANRPYSVVLNNTSTQFLGFSAEL